LGALTEENSQDDSTASRGNTPPPVADELEEYDNNAIEVQKEKIKLVFFRIDKNGNGKIEKDEFFDFIQGLGLNMPRSETNVIFESVDQDDNGFLCFGEFYDYFVNSIIGEKSGQNKSDAKLRAAFLAADRDGSGTVSFREFAEFAWSKRRDVALNDLLAAFERLDVDKSGEINYKEFREFFGNQRTSFGEGMIQTPGSAEPTPAFEEMMKGFYNAADAQQLANYLRNRWTKFASFKRAGASGDLVMKGSHDMVADCIPGEYSLIDLACFSDLAPIKPKTTIVKGVTWHKSSVPGKSGRLIFPMDFEAKIPTSFATNETLAYYECSMADGNQLKVSLLYRHGIQDFTYENNYLDEYVLNEKALGGAGLEKHGFAHLDCPLDEDSGFFMLGKFEGDELHLTAFKIPTRHTLYVPPMTIHCNDYLKGTWRTMLSDEAEIDHVQLVKMHRQGNMESYEHFRFNFLPLL
jgi:Ca2+-binding EF-hand superfamily protein